MTTTRESPVHSILIVDDDETFRTVLARALRARGYEAAVAGNYEDAVACALADPPDCALVDLQMPGRPGLDLVAALKRIHLATIVVVLTADRSPETKDAARKRGASAYLTKPTDADEVVAAFQAASESSHQ